MKKTITAIVLLAGAVSGYSQGEINFEAYGTGSATLRAPVYNIQSTATIPVTYAGHTVLEFQGGTTAALSNPKGTAAYSGQGLLGTGYDIQLFAGPSGATSYDQLQPVSQIFNFKTSTGLAGYMSGSQPVTLPASAAFGSGSTPTFAIAAWNNEGGTIGSLAAAAAADQNNSDPWGFSAIVQSTTPLNVSPSPTYANMPLPTGGLGFSLGNQIPEPSTIALGVMGASALLFRRRK